MDYQGLYEDLLDIEFRASLKGFHDLANECYRFRVDLLSRFKRYVGHVVIQ